MAVPYDVIREILVRVKDVTTLFRCATTCKAWRSLLVADSSFLDRCLPEDVSSPFPGFFIQRNSYTTPPPCFVPAVTRPVLGNGRRFLTSFIPNIPAGYFDFAAPLTSRRGLLLVRLQPPHGHACSVGPDPSGVLLAVCNPLAGTVHELPRLKHYWDWDFQQGSKVSGYALLTAADCCDNDGDGVQRRPGFFKVLIITVQHDRMHYDLHTFSSADDSGWNTCSGFHGVSAMLRQHNAVVLGGVAHWLLCGGTGTYSLDVRGETGHVSCTKMMGVSTYGFRNNFHGKPHLTVDRGGNLMVLSLQRDGRRLDISTSHDNGRSFKASTLAISQPDQPTNGTNHVYTCLGEKCGMMLVKVNHVHMHVNHMHVYIADVNTGMMREVPDWPGSNDLNSRKIVPFEIDWPGFFASRFGAGAKLGD